MKVMISELNMYQAQSHEYKYEMERLTREVQDLKRKYFQQKKLQETETSFEGSMDSYVMSANSAVGSSSSGPSPQVMMSRTAPNMTSKTRVAGGGFVIKQPI